VNLSIPAGLERVTLSLAQVVMTGVVSGMGAISVAKNGANTNMITLINITRTKDNKVVKYANRFAISYLMLFLTISLFIY